MATASHLSHPGTQTPPAIAASTVAVTNNFAFPCLVQIFGGTVSYAVAPTWTWYGLA